MADWNEYLQVLPRHRIVRCISCSYAIVPAHLNGHLIQHHPSLSLTDRRSFLTQLGLYKELASCPEEVQYPFHTDARVEGFPLWVDGYRCNWHDAKGSRCEVVLRGLRNIQQHCRKQHQWRNIQRRGGDKRQQVKESPNKMWTGGHACQQFFREPSWKRHFEVEAPCSPPIIIAADAITNFFTSQHSEVETMNAAAADGFVEGFDAHQSTVVPWLRTTGIAAHLQGLQKEGIRIAIQWPTNEEPLLQFAVEQLAKTLRHYHRQCFDGPDCRLTWPCQLALSNFRTSDADTIGKIRAWDPYKATRTLTTYFRYAQLLLCYYYRILHGASLCFSSTDENQKTPHDVVQSSELQCDAWSHLWRTVQNNANRPDNVDDEAFHRAFVRFFLALICCHTEAQRYSSPLVSFCAMLAVRSNTGSWMEPGNYNSSLSGMIWVLQLLIFSHSAQLDIDGEGKTLPTIQHICTTYAVQTAESPMGELLRWRLLLFHIAKNNVSTQQAEWDEAEEVLTYQGTTLRLDEMPLLLASEYKACQQLLSQDLLLGASLPRMHAWALKDNPSIATVDWSFVQDPDNQLILAGSRHALMVRIANSDRLRQMFVQPGQSPEALVRWAESAIASYLLADQEFRQRLCVLCFLFSGTPVRSDEFFSLTWKNTQRLRGLTIRHQRLMLHLQYHKGQQQTGRYKENVRFLPNALADLLLDYIVYVLPFRHILLRQTNRNAALSPFLWEKQGQVWPADALSEHLEAASVRAQIPLLHVQIWRQMTVAIVKTKFAAYLPYFELDVGDEDAEETEENIRLLTRQRNHSTRTANRAYANAPGATYSNVWDGLIRMGLRASTLWQDFWGVDIVLSSHKRKREEDAIGPMIKRIAAGRFQPRRPWSASELLAAMQSLLQQPTVTWRSPEQERAMVAIMSRAEQVVAILPTGAGKSMLFLLPCTLPDARITVLIVPLVALRVDLIRRIRALNVSFLEWTSGEHREAPLVIVSIEAATSKAFFQYAQGLIAQQKLDRIVIDECHLSVTAVEYRSAMQHIGELRLLRTQFVYLTATLPPSYQTEFEQRNYLCRPTIIRAASHRSNIEYVVLRIPSNSNSLLKQAALEAREIWKAFHYFDQSKDKILLYTNTLAEAEELAQLLACSSYTSALESVERKQAVLAAWTTDPTAPFLVATTALAEGFDYPYVRVVINVGAPRTLLTFAQESGRVGRDGQRAFSLVLLPCDWTSSNVLSPSLSQQTSVHDHSLRHQIETSAIDRYLRGEQCYRTSLSEGLDLPQHRRWCMKDDVACHACPVGGHLEPIPSTISFSSLVKKPTGLSQIQEAQLYATTELAQYRQDLATVRGSCLLCRGRDQPFDHPFHLCSDRFAVFDARNAARERHAKNKQKWLPAYSACFYCLNPQSICTRAHSSGLPHSTCEDGDIVLPLCYGAFVGLSYGPPWFQAHFQQSFVDINELFDWLGQPTQFGGQAAIQAVRVAAKMMASYREWVF